ncbi:hypothetical protein QTP86_020775, partial [Hemibagrus guttatus]
MECLVSNPVCGFYGQLERISNHTFKSHVQITSTEQVSQHNKLLYNKGIKAGYTLDGVPTHRRAHTHTHSHSLTQFHNLEMPINLPCMSLDWGRKLEETPKALGEHANSTHMAEAGIEPPTLE